MVRAGIRKLLQDRLDDGARARHLPHRRTAARARIDVS